jgi:hypothetical protein
MPSQNLLYSLCILYPRPCYQLQLVGNNLLDGKYIQIYRHSCKNTVEKTEVCDIKRLLCTISMQEIYVPINCTSVVSHVYYYFSTIIQLTIIVILM